MSRHCALETWRELRDDEPKCFWCGSPSAGDALEYYVDGDLLLKSALGNLPVAPCFVYPVHPYLGICRRCNIQADIWWWCGAHLYECASCAGVCDPKLDITKHPSYKPLAPPAPALPTQQAPALTPHNSAYCRWCQMYVPFLDTSPCVEAGCTRRICKPCSSMHLRCQRCEQLRAALKGAQATP